MYILGSVVESFVFGFVRVCVNGKLQVMREEDLQNEDIKLASIKGGGNFSMHSPYQFLNIFIQLVLGEENFTVMEMLL